MIFTDDLKAIDRCLAERIVGQDNGDVLRLNGLKVLGSVEAWVISKWEGRILELNGLRTLDRLTAEQLANWKGAWLKINGLTNVDPESIRCFKRLKVSILELNGLPWLGDEVIEHLSGRAHGHLCLKGVKQLKETSRVKLVSRGMCVFSQDVVFERWID